MKLLTTIIMTTIAVGGLVSCTGKKATEEQPAPKCLVLYYSQNGTTKAVAEELQKSLGADIEEIVAEEPYAGNFQETIERCITEREGQIIPKIKPLQANIADYDIVFLGFPIWFGTYARPIYGLLEVEKFAGKKIVPFCTFGSGGLETAIKDLKASLPEADIQDGYCVRTARIAAMPQELNRFLIEQAFIEGTVEPLPEFSEQQPVTETETGIFNAACSDYEYPLGTPETFAKRPMADGTEYCFKVIGFAPDGAKTSTTIYIIAPADTTAKPEFTRVSRD